MLQRTHRQSRGFRLKIALLYIAVNCFAAVLILLTRFIANDANYFLYLVLQFIFFIISWTLTYGYSSKNRNSTYRNNAIH